MHLSIIAYGTWGDVRPGIALGQALVAAGHDVQLVVTQDFAPWVRDSGLDVHLLPVDKHDVMQKVSSETRPWRVVRAIRSEIAPALLRAGNDMLTFAGDTDVLITTEWLLPLAAGIAQRNQIGLVHLCLQPRIRTRQMPITTFPALPAGLPFRQMYNSLTFQLAGFLRWWTHVSTLNSIRRDRLNLAPLTVMGYVDLISATPSVTPVSYHVVPRPTDWPAHHHLTGYLFYDDEGWRPPAALEEFLGTGPAPVYVGFGSMHDSSPTETTRLIVEALRVSRQRAVVYRGWAQLGTSELPDNIYRLDYAPHHWLFPRMAAVVHHAGAGTSAAALRAGIPSVPVPHSGDQAFWASRLASLGASTRPLARSRLTAAALANRITDAVRNPAMREKAARLGSRIRAEDGAGQAVAAIEDIVRGSQSK